MRRGIAVLVLTAFHANAISLSDVLPDLASEIEDNTPVPITTERCKTLIARLQGSMTGPEGSRSYGLTGFGAGLCAGARNETCCAQPPGGIVYPFAGAVDASAGEQKPCPPPAEASVRDAAPTVVATALPDEMAGLRGMFNLHNWSAVERLEIILRVGSSSQTSQQRLDAAAAYEEAKLTKKIGMVLDEQDTERMTLQPMSALASSLPAAVYTVANDGYLGTRECAGMLAYIIKNFDDLPPSLLFIHGGDRWDTAGAFSKFGEQIQHLVAKRPRPGYLPLSYTYGPRCMTADCNDPLSECGFMRQGGRLINRLRAKGWRLPRSRCVLANWCAHFMVRRPRSTTGAGLSSPAAALLQVSRRRIRAWPKAFYEDILDWLFYDDFVPDNWQKEKDLPYTRCCALEHIWHGTCNAHMPPATCHPPPATRLPMNPAN